MFFELFGRLQVDTVFLHYLNQFLLLLRLFAEGFLPVQFLAYLPLDLALLIVGQQFLNGEVELPLLEL